MTHCEKCGSVLGPGGHACYRPENRFSEFNPQPIPYRKEPLYPSPEALDAEVNRRLALLRKPSEILAEEELRQTNVQPHIETLATESIEVKP